MTDTWQTLCDKGRELADASDRNRWALGDLALSVEKAYGENRLADYASEIGVIPKTLYAYRKVSSFYEKATREEFSGSWLRWSHYRTAMRLGDVDAARELLTRALDANWSIRELTAAVNEAAGAPAKPRKVIEFEAEITGIRAPTPDATLIDLRADGLLNVQPFQLVGARYRVVIYQISDGEEVPAPHRPSTVAQEAHYAR